MTPASLLREFPKTEKFPALAFPKPSQIRRHHEAVIKMAGGREVCSNSKAGQDEYRRRTADMYERDNGICCICDQPIDAQEYPTFQHTNGRGMGGSRRDDRIQYNGVAHWKCNSELGSRHQAENGGEL
jgi:hypothetical protein